MQHIEIILFENKFMSLNCAWIFCLKLNVLLTYDGENSGDASGDVDGVVFLTLWIAGKQSRDKYYCDARQSNINITLTRRHSNINITLSRDTVILILLWRATQ